MKISKTKLRQIIKEELSCVLKESGPWQDVYYAEIHVDPYEHQLFWDLGFDEVRDEAFDRFPGLQSYDMISDKYIGVTGTKDAVTAVMDDFWPEEEFGEMPPWQKFRASLKHLGDSKHEPVGRH